MQVLLFDYSTGCGWFNGTPGEFTEIDLPVVDLPVRSFKIPPGGYRWSKKELLETDPRDLPPIVVAYGMLVDGAHRLRAAQVQELEVIRAIDAGRILPEACVQKYGISRLKPVALGREGGITRISLENARLLLAWYGPPDRIMLKERDREWVVEAVWGELTHEFGGLSWGYGGEGPRGLETFFNLVLMDPPITAAQISKWPTPGNWIRRQVFPRRARQEGPKEWAPEESFRRGFLKGVDYWKGWA